MTRVLVCGGRAYDDAERLFAVLDSYDNERDFSTLIEGAARGADTLARQWAEAKKIKVASFPANWKKHGKSAGIRRNIDMLEQGKPDLIIAFPGGRGTKHMVDIGRMSGVEVIEVGS